MNLRKVLKLLLQRWKTIKVTRIRSSNVKAFSYNPHKKRLQIQFLNDRIYQYDNVSIEKMNAFIDSPSKGAFIWSDIIPEHRAKRLK